jgi:NAD(P)-dependent dehydrogenase (short-subunit alcohol dehydrogenase family)
VNCIAPGAITLERYPSPHDVTPLGYQGIPDDIAGVVVFLCSEAAGYITGQTIMVTGGIGIP